MCCLQHDLQGHISDVNTCKFFPSGKVVLSGGADLRLKIWSAEDGSCPVTLKGHTGGISRARCIVHLFYVIILLHSKWVLFASALWSPDPKDFKIQEQCSAIFKLTKQTWSNKYLLIAKTLQFFCFRSNMGHALQHIGPSSLLLIPARTEFLSSFLLTQPDIWQKCGSLWKQLLISKVLLNMWSPFPLSLTIYL